jgi:4'-phosphopantetheinyl transferase superfamily
MLGDLKSCFTAYEWTRITGAGTSTEQEKLYQFCRHWTLKESFIKAISQGLGFELQEAEFYVPDAPLDEQLQRPSPADLASPHVIRTDTRVRIRGVSSPQWHFEEHNLDRWHAVAVALGPAHEAIPEFQHTLPIYVARSSSSVSSPSSPPSSSPPSSSSSSSSSSPAPSVSSQCLSSTEHTLTFDGSLVVPFVELHVRDLLQAVGK